MKTSLVFGLVAMLAFGAAGALSAQDENADGLDDKVVKRHRMGQRLDLSEEQREAVKATVDELKEAEATREDIHAAVGAKLQEMGVELPEGWEDRQAAREDRAAQHEERRTAREERAGQKAELREIVDQVREDGGTKEDVKAAVDQYREDNGIEAPADTPKKGRKARRFKGQRGGGTK